MSRTPDRRAVLAGIAALGATTLGGVAARAETSDPTGAAMRARATAFLASLEPEKAAAATFAFDAPERRRWNFMGPGAKPGLRLEQMTPDQRIVALELIGSGLGPEGMRKAEAIMVLQDVLRERGDGPSDRNRARFSIAIFGAPDPGSAWGWRLEGHHLSLSYTLRGDAVLSVTPSSFSSNPNVVEDGAHRGVTALVSEQRLGQRLRDDLAPAALTAATIRERGIGNVTALAGREARAWESREGVPLADLTQAQRELFWELASVYAVDHLPAPLAERARARLAAGDPMAARFAWAGSARADDTMYYRLHGDNLWIEFASLRNQPLHLHTIRHDTEQNLGDHALG